MTMAVDGRFLRSRSLAGDPNHPGRKHRTRPLPRRDMRDVPIPPPPVPAPPQPEDGTRLVWAPWAGEWQLFSAPCPLCDQVAPLVFPEELCARCAAAYPSLTDICHRVR